MSMGPWLHRDLSLALFLAIESKVFAEMGVYVDGPSFVDMAFLTFFYY